MTDQQKTLPTDQSVDGFLSTITPVSKRTDCEQLRQIFEEMTGYPAVMWGDTMIGFGHYHYRYSSGHEGDSFLVGFSPRKANISLYFATGPEREQFLARLGKHKTGKSCIYINKLADVDLLVLRELIVHSVAFLETTYPRS